MVTAFRTMQSRLGHIFIQPLTPICDWFSYLPEVIDQNCRESKACFLPDESRAYLLSGKVFYFLTEKQVKEKTSLSTQPSNACICYCIA